MLLVLIVFYIVLGMFMDVMSMLVATVPITYPIVKALGVDPIWFGIVIVMVVELGLISPPVGMNLFVVQSMLKTPLGMLWRWIAPFTGPVRFTNPGV